MSTEFTEDAILSWLESHPHAADRIVSSLNSNPQNNFQIPRIYANSNQELKTSSSIQSLADNNYLGISKSRRGSTTGSTSSAIFTAMHAQFTTETLDPLKHNPTDPNQNASQSESKKVPEIYVKTDSELAFENVGALESGNMRSSSMSKTDGITFFEHQRKLAKKFISENRDNRGNLNTTGSILFALAQASSFYSSLDLRQIIGGVLQIALEFVPSDRSLVFLVDTDRNVSYSAAIEVEADCIDESQTVSDSNDRLSSERVMKITRSVSVIRSDQDAAGNPENIISIVAKGGKTVFVSNAENDPRVNSVHELNQSGPVRNIMAMPIFGGPQDEDGKGQMLGIACLINRRGKPFQEFTDVDKKYFADFLVIVGMAMFNIMLYKVAEEREEKAQALAMKNLELYHTAAKEATKFKALLELAHDLFVEDDVGELGRKIMQQAQKLVCADKASFFVVDEEKHELQSAFFEPESGEKLSIPMSKGIAGYVATKGESVNVEDAYSDARFNKDVDRKTGYRTQSILCMPVPGPSQKIVGVTNLINKKAAGNQIVHFTKEDEELLKAFSVFSGLALHKNLLLEENRNKSHMLALTMEIMSYHATCHAKELTLFLSKSLSPPPIEEIRKLEFDMHQFDLNDDRLVAITKMMYLDLPFANKYAIPEEKLTRYILTLRKNYRHNAYHNFTHAVSVTHAVYQMITNFGLNEELEDVELFSMFWAALNHDIDHRGKNNQFEKNAHTALASFYGTSTLERHHFNHAMTILSTEGHNVFERLGREYSKCLKCFEQAILSTDLSIYFSTKEKVRKMFKEDRTAIANDLEMREMFRGLIMTCCDLTGMTKPFHNSRMTSDAVYSEFFQQGDEEKRMGLPLSSKLMDRTHEKEIPQMQFDFMTFVVRPAFDILSIGMPKTVTLLNAVDHNIATWKRFIGKDYTIGMELEDGS
ncbi:cGMP-specific 3',5'-cyclic phosphodiesterase [Nowakowskiella sp. JEL0407]|nr:cGMP-specific 3',5'-cyclic phosphodiesterase [Nowakowskiella sp. JEL0407]